MRSCGKRPWSMMLCEGSRHCKEQLHLVSPAGTQTEARTQESRLVVTGAARHDGVGVAWHVL